MRLQTHYGYRPGSIGRVEEELRASGGPTIPGGNYPTFQQSVTSQLASGMDGVLIATDPAQALVKEGRFGAPPAVNIALPATSGSVPTRGGWEPQVNPYDSLQGLALRGQGRSIDATLKRNIVRLPDARPAYGDLSGARVAETGWMEHPSMRMRDVPGMAHGSRQAVDSIDLGAAAEYARSLVAGMQSAPAAAAATDKPKARIVKSFTASGPKKGAAPPDDGNPTGDLVEEISPRPAGAGAPPPPPGDGGDAPVTPAVAWNHELGRYRGDYKPIEDFLATMGDVPLGGHVRALAENLGAGPESAKWWERGSAVAVGVGVPVLLGAIANLGNEQTPGTIPLY